MSDEPTSDQSAESMNLGSDTQISATPPILDENASDRTTVYRLSPKVEEKRIAEIACDFLENPRKPFGVPASLKVIAMSTGRGQTAESIARRFFVGFRLGTCLGICLGIRF
jgi:hypothetical protein